MTSPPKRAARIVDRKLGRRRAAGFVQDFKHMPDRRYVNTIYVDPRQSDRDYFGTIIHELIHIAMPTLTEPAVLELEAYLAKSLWKFGYRKQTR